jgi:hypothetical protein
MAPVTSVSYVKHVARGGHGRALASAGDRHQACELAPMTARPGKPPPKDLPTDESGHLGVDDRGNVTWEWADDQDLQADDTFGATARLQALTDPTLQITEDEGPSSPSEPNPKRLTSGYNPYDSGALGRAERKKPKNLRELSKWIELRKKMAAKGKDE